MKEEKSVVLISGCSSGIGLALAKEFSRHGHAVFATARDLKKIAHLASEGLNTLQLDVTDGRSVKRCIDTVVAAAGRLDILVNCAGYGQMGPVAELSMEDLRRQFETNVFGPVSMIQHAVPRMIQQGGGMIVNVGSVSGIVVTPFAGAYCASKSAIHGLSDALRMELAPFGIRVISVQPGSVASSFGANAMKNLAQYRGKPSAYAPIFSSIERRAEYSQTNASPADEIAARLYALLTAKNPKPVIRVGRESFKLPLYKAILPRAVADSIMTRMFGLNTLTER
jgi:NAD(P)-dependent dehydrogenase (short-subunit alcohol dehydrogenase family)